MELYVGSGRLLCKVEEFTEELESGIVMPSSAMDALKAEKATVVQVNCDEWNDGDVKVGDVVYFGKFAGSEVIVADERFLVISAEEVLLATR